MRPKKILSILFVATLMIGGAVLWFFNYGGAHYIAVRFLPAPTRISVALPDPTVLLAQEAFAQPPAQVVLVEQKPTAQAYSHVIALEYFQRANENEFVITANRELETIVTKQLSNPARQVFYLEFTKSKLEKEQYFLPYEFVRTINFEQHKDVLEITFIGQNSDYLPAATWQKQGRDLVVRFKAQ